MSRTKRFDAATVSLPRKVREAFPNLKTVSDATTNVLVKVTGNDRRKANPLKQESCAMARACKRDLHVDGAFIGISRSYLVRGTHAVRYTTPSSLAREIVTFDRHQDFAAGDYELAKMAPQQRFGQLPKGRHGGEADGSRPRTLRRSHRTVRIRAMA